MISAGHYVRSAILVGSIPLLERWGGDARALAAEIGIEPLALTDPDLPVPASQIVDFYERAAQGAGCSRFGLHMAARTGLAVIGPLWLWLRQAQTVGAMLEDLVTHFALYTHAAVASFRAEGEDHRLAWAVAAGVADSEVQVAEYSLAILCAELRRHAPSGWEPKAVHFRHSAPRDRAAMRRVFGPHLYFDQPDNSLLLELALFDRPLQMVGSRTRTLSRHLLQMPSAAADDAIAGRVDGAIRAMLPYRRCTLADVGRVLGMAPRTLQEHLQGRGDSFQKIRDAVRADLAGKYLRHSRMSLAQISQILGYSELSAFSRSFRRWHGVTARSLRRGQGRPEAAVAESRDFSSE